MVASRVGEIASAIREIFSIELAVSNPHGVRRGNFMKALVYRRSVPRYLAVRALKKLGRDDEAKTRGEAFLTRFQFSF